MFIETKELEEHLKKGKDDPLTSSTLALIHEQTENY